MTSAATTTMMMIGTRTTIASFVVEETVIGSESFPGMGPAALCPLSMYWSTRAGVSGVIASVSLVRAWPVKFAAYQIVPNAGGPGTETEYRLLLSANVAATGCPRVAAISALFDDDHFTREPGGSGYGYRLA